MSETSVYVVKTTANQERSVANMIAQIARKEKYDIRALLVPGCTERLRSCGITSS